MTDQISLDAIEKLNRVVADILDPQDSRAYSFISFVALRIRQFRLEGRLEPNEVINEAYQRAIKAIEEKKEISNWQAWLKVTCLNVVRENSRQRQRCLSIDPQSSMVEALASNQLSTAYLTHESAKAQRKMTILSQALRELAEIDPESSRLLKLKLVDGRSWTEIRDYLQKETNNEVPALAALRKRASRAKKALQRLYHEIESDSLNPVQSGNSR